MVGIRTVNKNDNIKSDNNKGTKGNKSGSKRGTSSKTKSKKVGSNIKANKMTSESESKSGDTNFNSTNSKTKKNDIGNSEKTKKKERAKQTLGVNRLQSRTTRSKSKMPKKRKFDTCDDNDTIIDIVKPS